MNNKQRNAFTLVEVLIVVVIMAVLAATIIPQFSDSTTDAKTGAAEFNLHTIRSQIELYKSQHDGDLPSADLSELVGKTNKDGTIGTGTGYIYGPYVLELPPNSFTTSNSVVSITSSPAASSDVTATDGWLYNATTGEIWINHADHYTK